MSSSAHGPGSFCWFECASTDAAAAKHFYTDVFRWTAADVPMPGEVESHYTLLKVGDVDMAGLYQMSGPHFEGVPAHWVSYVKVESADASAELARSLGGTVVVPPFDVPGVGRMAFLQDPPGANFAVFEPREHEGCGTPETRHGSLGWCALSTSDTEVSKEFYPRLFGWEARTGDDGYTEFVSGGRCIGGMSSQAGQPTDAPPSWLPYALVDDCDASAARVEELGGRLLVPPCDAGGVGRFAVFSDPQGACLAFITMKHG